jgi:hypothetical protein
MIYTIDLYIVTDAMQRESAIADDFWRNIFRHPKKNRIDAILENIERKYRNELLFFSWWNLYIYIYFRIDHIKNRHLHRQISEESDL